MSPPPHSTESLPPDVLARLAELVRAGTRYEPGHRALDLYSEDAFLARRLAAGADRWTTFSAVRDPDLAPDNGLPAPPGRPRRLPFADGSLDLITGAFLDGPLGGWGPATTDDLFRVLAPGGEFLVLSRGPSPKKPDTVWTIPIDSRLSMAQSGFEEPREFQTSLLPDGSGVYEVYGKRPGRPRRSERGKH